MANERQPLNILAPFRIQKGDFEVTDDGDVIANVVAVQQILFPDGSSMDTASSGGGTDGGTF